MPSQADRMFGNPVPQPMRFCHQCLKFVVSEIDQE